jgi:membrane-associated phospholipid phosphatase/tRNA A-37 threonylcarbamoyl transferase component Bud32
LEDTVEPASSAGGAPTTTLAAPPASRRRQRRPSGAPPPLPRSVGSTGKVWLGLAAVAAVVLIWVPVAAQPRVAEHAETEVLRGLANLRTPWLSDVMGVVNATGRVATPVLGLGTLLALVGVRRWRHVFTYVGAFMALALFGESLYQHVARPRPYGVRIIGDWGGFAMPSPPVAALTTILVSIAYSLVVAGRPRQVAKVVIGAVLGAVALSRLYLAVDHPSDVVYSVILGVSIPLLAFRLFTPNQAFPVVYRRGKKAHLDVGGARGRAIREAIEQQLGLTVLEVKPVGLEGSGGSTPLRVKVSGDPPSYVFAKLYAKSHLMADRWYKLGRSILYGALEDETPFRTVRRFVESEDYTLRLLRDSGIPTAAPYGIVEITPEREYMLVTEFLDGATEIGDAEVDDVVIDNGLELVRKLWDSGLAHRDIKPANLLVRDRVVYLIDPFFVQVRPSPWRQAVDLANMMLVLAVRNDPERVYERALRWFTPEEIAEAFAATRGVASPTQLRTAVKRDGRDLLTRFRAMAPHRPPVGIQRWSVRRVGTAMLVVTVFVVAFLKVVDLFSDVHALAISSSPECGANSTVIVMAQAVPSASLIPCVEGLPSGWHFNLADVRNDKVQFWLDSDQSGRRAVRVTLTSSCDVSGTTRISTDEDGTERHEAPLPTARSPLVRFYVFAGGCATYRFSRAGGGTAEEVFYAERALSFTPRSELVRHVQREDDLVLCGLGARCPG